MGLLDLIFPKYCVNCKSFGDFLCPDCFARLSFDTKNICLECGKGSFDGLTHPRCLRRYSASGSFTGVVFNSVSKKLIYQFKYKPYLSSLSSFMTDLLYESLIQNEEFMKLIANGKWLMVPIPLSNSKFKKRGYNQSEILAKKLARKLGFEVCDCLIRIKETKTQVGLNRKERRENIAGAFSLKNQFINYIKNKNMLLVDDVLTSGATASEAAKILKKSGAKSVWVLAFAKED